MRTKILSEMAKTLRIRVEQLDIFEGGYVPQGHVNIEREQAAIRRLLSEIADGKRSLPIEVRTGNLQMAHESGALEPIAAPFPHHAGSGMS
jgi:hypothetical protein